MSLFKLFGAVDGGKAHVCILFLHLCGVCTAKGPWNLDMQSSDGTFGIRSIVFDFQVAGHIWEPYSTTSLQVLFRCLEFLVASSGVQSHLGDIFAGFDYCGIGCNWKHYTEMSLWWLILMQVLELSCKLSVSGSIYFS